MARVEWELRGERGYGEFLFFFVKVEELFFLLKFFMGGIIFSVKRKGS